MRIDSLLPLAFVLCFALLIREHRRHGRRAGAPELALLLAPAIFAILIVLAHWGVLGRLDPLLCAFAPLSLPPLHRLRSDRSRFPRFLSSSWAPVLAGVLTSCCTWWIWGSLSAIPVIHDEASYLLQARIFASGHWTAPGRPLPEFFEQVHVLVTPVLAGKYPPGHSMALVPGIWLGLPGLIPVLLAGGNGAILFTLARRLAGSPVAALTWLFWVTAPGTLDNRASYLSQTTSGLLWMLAGWALLEWREKRGTARLLVVAGCVGWGILTRPLTMAALAIPIGVVVIRNVAARRAWRELGWALALGAGIVAIMPLWSLRTIGDWRTTPYRQYSRIYFPYQWAGFAVDESPPQRLPPPAMEEFDRQFRRIQREHRVGALPRILPKRLAAIARDMWGSGRGVLLLFAILGLFRMSREIAFALASSALLVVAYLVYAHDPAWTVYYLELQPVLAFLTATGLWWSVSTLTARLRERTEEGGKPEAGGQFLPVALIILATLVPSVPDLAQARLSKQRRSDYQREFGERIAGLPAGKAIVFVRYSSTRDVHRALVFNEPDLRRARVWVVHDRGSENEKLMRFDPSRAPYLYDEARGSLLPLSRAHRG